MVKQVDKGLSYREISRQVSIGRLFEASRWGDDPRKTGLVWHIYVKGSDVTSTVHDKSGYAKGPAISIGDLQSSQALREITKGLSLQGRVVVGIMVHVADDFAVSSIRSAKEGPEHYRHGSILTQDNPAAMLDEKPTGDGSYLYLPLPGAKRAVAIKINETRFTGLTQLALSDPEVRVGIYSAPLEYLVRLSGFVYESSETLKLDADQCLTVALLYSNFIAIGIISEGGLHSIATLPIEQRTGEFRRSMTTAIRSAGFESSSLFVIESNESCGSAILSEVELWHTDETDEAEQASIFTELLCADYATVTQGITVTRAQPDVSVTIEMLDVPANVGAMFLQKSAPLMVASAASNVSSAARKSAQLRVTRSDAAIVVFARGLKAAAVIALIAGFGFMAWTVYGAVSSPAYRLEQAAADRAVAEAARLSTISSAVETWSRVIAPRSQAWAVMEVSSQLFPERLGVTLNSVRYQLQFGDDLGTGAKGFDTVYEFAGVGPKAAVDQLETLDERKIKEVFESVAGVASNSFFSDPNASIRVLVTSKQGQFETDGALDFNVQITRTTQGESEYALPASTSILPAIEELMKPVDLPTTL